MKVRLSLDLIKYENWEIDIEQTAEPQLTVSKDGEELRLVFDTNAEYRMFVNGWKDCFAKDQNWRRVYLTSLSRK